MAPAAYRFAPVILKLWEKSGRLRRTPREAQSEEIAIFRAEGPNFGGFSIYFGKIGGFWKLWAIIYIK